MKHLSFLPKKSPIRARAVLATGAVLGLGAVLTFAAFTDEGYVASTFSTGTVNLTFDGGAEGTPTPHTTALGFTVGKIGTTTIAPLTVNNDGTLPFTYGMTTSAASNGPLPATTLISGLHVTIASVATAGACDSTSFGSPIYSGTGLTAAALSGRSLLAGTHEVLCFKVDLPTGASDNAMQGLSTTATFAFAATQS